MIKRIKDRIQGKAPAGVKRSSRWSEVRKAFLAKNPACALCGGKKKLEVHHKKPFHHHPELELDEGNLIVLCEAKVNGIVCHQAFGHLGNYKCVNDTVEDDVRMWREKVAASREEERGRAATKAQAKAHAAPAPGNDQAGQ